MQVINLLPSEIYNKISAGEVVENPASVVKELVENSIDAGSNNIVIDIVDGGITSIIISDNGHGISRDYIKNAFLPHATSKIKSSEDLENISTLGFRGEALPSIVAISSVQLTTKAIDEFVGSKYCIKGGVGEEITDVDCNYGTTIEVRNLFFNTPARQKFLKKPKSEEHEITAIVQGLILANPNVAIKYVADGKVIFNSNGKGLENALYSIYPSSITKNMVYIESERYNIQVRGYISLPNTTKSNRTFQTTIVNGRLIKNSLIETAVSNAYGNSLMKRSYPIFCLEILMPFDMLDVNVTPNKTDVRFSDPRSVFSSIYNAVKNCLERNQKYFEAENNSSENDKIVASIIEENKQNNYENTSNLEQKSENNSKLSQNIEQNSSLNNILDRISNLGKVQDIDNKSQKANQNIEKTCNLDNATNIKENSLLNKFSNIKADKKFEIPNNSPILKACDSVAETRLPNIKKPQIESDLFSEIEEEFSLNHRIIGQLFNCYLIVTKGANAYIIDQHATHERLIYDKLIVELESKNIATQPLLASQIVTLSPQDCTIIEELLEDINKLGFEMEQFGDYTYKINSVPIIFENFNCEKFINSLLEEKFKLKRIDIKEILHDEIAKKACKSAIKAGQKLSDFEIESLIKNVEQNKPVQCPHGRPTIIKFNKKDIDKVFKRII